MSSAPIPLDIPAESVYEVDEQHVVQNYGRRLPVAIERGKGVYVWDVEGKKYLDLISGIGVCALGHSHPRITKAIREQVGRLVHCSNLYHHPYQGPLAKRLAEASELPRAFFCNSGAEAVEAALKTAKGYGRRQNEAKFEVVALNGSFAGRTMGAISLTGQAKYREPFAPGVPGIRFVDPNDVAGLDAAVGPNTAGIFFEPILGEGGIVEISREFGLRAAQLAKEHDALLILDEIQCGLGRTGSYFAFQEWNRPTPEDPDPEQIVPDVVTVAKPLGAGLPIGALLMNEKAADVLQPGMHGTTFGGNALATRVALEFLDVLDEILPSARETAIYFRRRLAELQLKHSSVLEIRGRGLMIGVRLDHPGGEYVTKLLERGFLINCTAGDVLRFLPPYVLERKHVDSFVGALDELLAAHAAEA